MRFVKRIQKRIGWKGIKVVVLIFIFAIAYYFTYLTGAFFWTLFFTFLLFKIDSKYVGQAALICLVLLPFLLSVNKEAVAEQVAVYAFFLLTITVALQIAELKRNPAETIHIPVIDDTVTKIKHVLDLRGKAHVLDLRTRKYVLDLRDHIKPPKI